MSGLEPVVFLAKSAKVMLTMNLQPDVGLCNGATGMIIDFIYHVNHQPPDLPVAVIVQFDDYRGPSISNTLPSINCTNMPSDYLCSLAWQWNPRKATAASQTCICSHNPQGQGLTLPKAWIDIGKSESTPGVTYVALSRIRNLSSCVLEAMTLQRNQHKIFTKLAIQAC